MGKRGRMCADLFPDLLECSSSSAATPSTSSWNDNIDRLSELPDVLRLHILSLLPLKSAIRTGVLSSRWRGLWAHRWPDPSSLFLSSQSSTLLLPNPAAVGQDDAFVSSTNRCLAQRGRRRIDSLVLSFHQGQVLQSDLKQWLEYAAACSVEDFHLHVLPAELATASVSLPRRSSNTNRRKNGTSLSFHFPMESPLLTRLSIRGTHLSAANSASTRLEILALHSVTLSEAALRKVVAACPVLRCLDIRCCRELRRIQISASGPHLRSLTVVDCPKATELVVTSAPGLRSFRFCGAFLSKYSIENVHRLEEVYFSSAGPSNLFLPNSNWVSCFERLANVTVHTLCSHALQYIAVRGAGTIGPMRSLYRLEELQLLMLMMSDSNLNDVFAFLKLYQCPVLERLFVELPTCTLDQHVENYMEIADEEPPRDYLDKLKTIKVRNYKGHYNEIRLVQFLLAKATNLSSLIIIAPRENFEKEYSKDPSDWLHSLHMQLCLFHKASENARICFSECDIDGIQPTHSEAFFKF